MKKTRKKFIKIFLAIVIIILFTGVTIFLYQFYNYKQGEKFQENKEYDKAISCYQKIKFVYDKAKNNEQECYYQRAIELRNKNDFENAINYFNKINNYKDTQEQLKEVKYQYGIYNYQIGKIEKAKKYLDEFKDRAEAQEYLNKIELLLNLQGVWKSEKTSSAIKIKDDILESYSCFGSGKSPLYKYTIGNSSSRYFKVDNRSGKIKLEGNKVKVYKDNEEITSMNLEWNNETNNIIDYNNILEVTYIKTRDDIKEVEAIKEPSIGMTKNEVLNSTWGEPEDINKTTTKYGTSEQWCYNGNKYIYFEDGIVTSIQD